MLLQELLPGKCCERGAGQKPRPARDCLEMTYIEGLSTANVVRGVESRPLREVSLKMSHFGGVLTLNVVRGTLVRSRYPPERLSLPKWVALRGPDAKCCRRDVSQEPRPLKRDFFPLNEGTLASNVVGGALVKSRNPRETVSLKESYFEGLLAAQISVVNRI